MREMVRKGCEFQDGLPLSPSGRELHTCLSHPFLGIPSSAVPLKKPFNSIFLKDINSISAC